MNTPGRKQRQNKMKEVAKGQPVGQAKPENNFLRISLFKYKREINGNLKHLLSE